jgi:hypothetical protein
MTLAQHLMLHPLAAPVAPLLTEAYWQWVLLSQLLLHGRHVHQQEAAQLLQQRGQACPAHSAH